MENQTTYSCQFCNSQISKRIFEIHKIGCKRYQDQRIREENPMIKKKEDYESQDNLLIQESFENLKINVKNKEAQEKFQYETQINENSIKKISKSSQLEKDKQRDQVNQKIKNTNLLTFPQKNQNFLKDEEKIFQEQLKRENEQYNTQFSDDLINKLMQYDDTKIIAEIILKNQQVKNQNQKQSLSVTFPPTQEIFKKKNQFQKYCGLKGPNIQMRQLNKIEQNQDSKNKESNIWKLECQRERLKSQPKEEIFKEDKKQNMNCDQELNDMHKKKQSEDEEFMEIMKMSKYFL